MAIEIKNVSKIYRIYDKPIDRLKETFNLFKNKKYHKIEKWGKPVDYIN